MDLIPYTGEAPERQQQLRSDMVQGVMITMLAEDETRLNLLSKIGYWFADRPEVSLIDHGVTDKQGLRYIVLEWNGYDVDPLFLAILDEEALIEDYTVYTREG